MQDVNQGAQPQHHHCSSLMTRPAIKSIADTQTCRDSKDMQHSVSCTSESVAGCGRVAACCAS
eukprot:2794329-Rhodomonas_salina.2